MYPGIDVHFWGGDNAYFESLFRKENKIPEDYYDVNIDPSGCISEKPVEYTPSKKAISVWDLNK